MSINGNKPINGSKLINVEYERANAPDRTFLNDFFEGYMREKRIQMHEPRVKVKEIDFMSGADCMFWFLNSVVSILSRREAEKVLLDIQKELLRFDETSTSFRSRIKN